MQLNFQLASQSTDLPSEADFIQWAGAALEHLQQNSESTSLCIRLVDEEEISTLNQSYRNKDGSTNVLSFPQHLPDYLVDITKEKPLGDILLCAPVIDREADQQGKKRQAHWAHLTVHGVLHLLDYDHQTPEEAEQMEGIEIAILQQLGFANPY